MPYIDQFTIEKILDAADIYDVVSQFVSLRRSGSNYMGICPFHNEKTPSFSVSPSKRIYKCFSCGKAGNAIHFIMEHEQMSYPQAVEWLAERYNVPFAKKEMTPQEKLRQDKRESLFILNEFALQWFQKQLHDTPMGQAVAMSYFRSRGFQDATINKFRLGYSPDSPDAFSKEALAKGFKREYLLESGLCIEGANGQLRDRFKDRCIFPVLTTAGRVVAFGGRIMKKDDHLAKYVNSPESEIYHKSDELYGIYPAKEAIRKSDRCYLVEGYIDVTSMSQSGVCNVVASSGTSLTEGQIRLIHRFTSNITVIYDGDAAGQKASVRAIDMLLKEGMDVKVLLLPEKEDPDSFARSHTATEFQDYIEKYQEDFMDFKLRLLADKMKSPMGRAEVVKDLSASIALISDPIVRAMYAKECGARMSINEQLVINEVNRAIIANKQTATYAGRLPKETEQNTKELEQTRQALLGSDPTAQRDNTESPAATDRIATQNETQTTPEPAEEDPIELLRQQIREVLHSDKARLVPKEVLLAKLVVRYGERVMCYTSMNGQDDYPLQVGEYITAALANDNIELCHPVYKSILDLYVQNYRNPHFIAEKFYLSYPDNPISLTAASLLEDRYRLSSIFKDDNCVRDEDRLLQLTTHIVSDYQLAVINYQIQNLSREMQNPERDLSEIMNEYKQMLQARNELAKTLGSRVINN